MRAGRSGRFADRRGFTMHEVLVVTALGMVMVAAIFAFNRFQLFALQNQVSQLDVQTVARDVIDLFAREVRRAGMDPTCAKTFSALAEATTSGLRIQSDLNGDGDAGDTNEDLTYRYNYETFAFERVAGGVADVLFSHVNPDGSALRFFNSAGDELVPNPTLNAAERNSVRRIRLQLKLSGSAVDPTNHEPLVSEVSTDVELRNRFFIASTACP